MTESKNLAFDLTCDVICDLQIILCGVFGKFIPVAIKYGGRNVPPPNSRPGPETYRGAGVKSNSKMILCRGDCDWSALPDRAHCQRA